MDGSSQVIHLIHVHKNGLSHWPKHPTQTQADMCHKFVTHTKNPHPQWGGGVLKEG